MAASDDARIAAIFGWDSVSIRRQQGINHNRVLVSWFPVNSQQCVLYPGLNRAQIGHLIPMSKALEEEYRTQSAVRSKFNNMTPRSEPPA